MEAEKSLRRIRAVLLILISGLVAAGVTAIPIRFELGILNSLFGQGTLAADAWPALGEWISKVHEAFVEMDNAYPFLSYGYDWLAFGHFVIAVAFIGAYRNPIRNRWVVDFGIIASALLVPYALIFGQLRGIPLFWRSIDSLFGIVGFALLWYARRELERIEKIESSTRHSA